MTQIYQNVTVLLKEFEHLTPRNDFIHILETVNIAKTHRNAFIYTRKSRQNRCKLRCDLNVQMLLRYGYLVEVRYKLLAPQKKIDVRL